MSDKGGAIDTRGPRALRQRRLYQAETGTDGVCGVGHDQRASPPDVRLLP